jgi:hypothetical protein
MMMMMFDATRLYTHPVVSHLGKRSNATDARSRRAENTFTGDDRRDSRCLAKNNRRRRTSGPLYTALSSCRTRRNVFPVMRSRGCFARQRREAIMSFSKAYSRVV